jgi:carbon starvation protein
MPGAILASAIITGAWGALIYTGNITTIWPMFGIANQLLAVMALALVTTWLVNTCRGRYAWVTILPMLFVVSTTMTAGTILVTDRFPADIRAGKTAGYFNLGLTLFVMTTVGAVLLWAVTRWVAVLSGMVPTRLDQQKLSG